jgi:hypothetical protein
MLREILVNAVAHADYNVQGSRWPAAPRVRVTYAGVIRIARPHSCRCVVSYVYPQRKRHTCVPGDVSIYADPPRHPEPGPFPPDMTVEDLKAAVSQVRNRAIAKTLNALGHMEEQGTAYARIREAMSEGYPEPEWVGAGPVLRVVPRPHPGSGRPRRAARGGGCGDSVVAFLSDRPPTRSPPSSA